MAKFPSRKDDCDVALWEHFCHLLAKQTGINAADTHILQSSKNNHALLSSRFDRTADGKRMHFASAMTLLGLTDGCNADTGNGYLDIVDFIIRGCCDVEKNLRELYRRVAFNICVGNSDDHFRNHGCLLTSRGWILSPAYDIKPTTNEYQSLLISESSSMADLRILLYASDDYMIRRTEAETIITEVTTAVSHWKTLVTKLGIQKREMAMFEDKSQKLPKITSGCIRPKGFLGRYQYCLIQHKNCHISPQIH